MKFNMNFTIKIKCDHYRKIDTELIEKDIELELNIDKEIASNIIFRFTPPIFNIGKYNVVMKTNDLGILKMIFLNTNDEVFIITNINQFMADVVEGYIRIRTTEKITSIMEFDFETSLQDSDGIVDEFDLK